MNIEIKLSYDREEEVIKLFTEYTETLKEKNPRMAIYLEIQNYAKELEELKSKYGLPEGRLYLAYCDNKIAGCIALRKFDDKNCEMKRLFVRPEFRKTGVGKKMVEKIIEDAKEIGYSHMLLDTMPILKEAINLYKGCGFYEIEQYNDSPEGELVYMKYDL